MANDSNSFFYWYKRYKVRAQDMTDFQSAMVQSHRAHSEGLVGASVLQGFDVAIGSGLSVIVASGIAVGASGYLDVINQSTTVDASAATGSSPSRSLIVVSPDPTDSNFIPSPTSPFSPVPLYSLQKAKVRLIAGTPGLNPEYPSKGANDAIICGVILRPGVTQIDATMLDFEVKEIPGSNSKLSQNQVRYDNRLRPFRNTFKTLGIKPSQSSGSDPVAFSYSGRGMPSAYPLSGGSYSPGDSFVDFSTGLISGADTTSGSFSPTIPTGSNSIICAVTLTRNDTLNFVYGTVGSFAQCMTSIRQQSYVGAGSLPPPDGDFIISYVVVNSIGGSFSDIQVFDARPFLSSGSGAAKFKQERPSGLVNGSNDVFTLSKTPADKDSVVVWLDANPLEQSDYTINSNVITITNPDVIPVAGQIVYAYYLIYGAVPISGGGGSSTTKYAQEVPTGAVDGSNAVFGLASTPVDPLSLVLWVDENALTTSDYTLAGNIITITNADFIPQLGQTIYAYYLYLGTPPMGGGGGGGSIEVHGSAAAPVAIDPTVGIAPSSAAEQVWWVRPNSGSGQIPITASPAIAAGSSIGQRIKIKSVAVSGGSPYLQIPNGSGTDMDGPINMGIFAQAIDYTWDGTNWSEDSRRV